MTSEDRVRRRVKGLFLRSGTCDRSDKPIKPIVHSTNYLWDFPQSGLRILLAVERKLASGARYIRTSGCIIISCEAF